LHFAAPWSFKLSRFLCSNALPNSTSVSTTDSDRGAPCCWLGHAAALPCLCRQGPVDGYCNHCGQFKVKLYKQTPWLEFASELYRQNDRRLSAKLVPTSADRGCHVVSVTDPYGRILGFLDRTWCVNPIDNTHYTTTPFTHIKYFTRTLEQSTSFVYTL
jgi:hypothetical protein